MWMNIFTDMETLRILFPMIGKLCISSSFAMIYVYSAELFPTVVRNIGVGSCSMMARVGSILAPYVKELVSSFTTPGVMLPGSSRPSIFATVRFIFVEQLNRLTDDIN